MKLLTNLLFEPKGRHDPALAYNIKDTVMSADGSRVYFALQDVPAGTALSDGDYWKLQIDLSGSKSAMDEALASFGNYAKEIGTKVRGETAKATGNPVSFLPDAGSLLQPITVLEPRQEGSGDPYPAGGGRNLFNPQQEYDFNFDTTIEGDVITTQFESSGGLRLRGLDVYPAGTYSLSIVSVGEPAVMVLWMYYADNNEEARLADIDTNTTAVTFTASRPFKIAFGGKYAHPITTYSYKVQLESGSVPTPYVPCANIRPFIGYDALNLNHVEKNLFNVNGENTGSIPTIRIENDRIVIDSLADGNSSYVIYRAMYKRGKYTFSAKLIGEKATAIRIVTSAEHTGGRYNAFYGGWFSDISSGGRLVFETVADFSVTIVIVGDGGTAAEAYDIMLAYGDVDATYASYQDRLHTIQIGQTVYGGRYEWLTGRLAKEWTGFTLNGSEYIAAFGADYPHLFQVKLSEIGIAGSVMSSHYKPFAGSYDEPCIYLFASGDYALINDPRFSNADDFMAALAASPVQIAYRLATPIEIQLPPHIISAADPEQTNILYGDGVIEVEYVKPLHVSIEERVAAIASAMLMKEE